MRFITSVTIKLYKSDFQLSIVIDFFYHFYFYTALTIQRTHKKTSLQIALQTGRIGFYIRLYTDYSGWFTVGLKRVDMGLVSGVKFFILPSKSDLSLKYV